MKFVAAVFADFVHTVLGRPAQLRTVLAGRPVLQRMLERLLRVAGLAHRCLLVRPRDQALAEETLRAFGLHDRIDVLALDTAPRPRDTLLRTARKWNLHSWRGGLLGATWFDEYVEVSAAGRVLEHYQADAVLCCDGHQAALDPGIADALLAHQRDCAGETAFTFSQAPPGLAGIVLTPDSIADVTRLGIPVGLLVSYRPELAQYDPITRPPCCHIAPEVAQTGVRVSADTRRARESLADAFAALGNDADAVALCAHVNAARETHLEPLPCEVEIELTTDHPLPRTLLRPTGDRVPARRLTDLDALDRVAAELSEYDDRLVFLAGHGDPLLHPQFAEICRRVRAAGVCGLGVATPLVELSDATLDVLLTCPVDVIEVQIDAHTPETYRRVHHDDRFAVVMQNLQRLQDARIGRNAPQPLVVPSITRCVATLADIEPFFDHWIPAAGSAVIRGYNDRCGRFPADELLATVPPRRERCRRLESRLMLLADCQAVRCEQDYTSAHSLGDWRSQPLREIWSNRSFQHVREHHVAGRFEAVALCGTCNEWFRP